MRHNEPYLPQGSDTNFAPNTTHWQPGDLVLHDADAKNPDMLMRVVNYARDGKCRTEYLDNTPQRKRVWGSGNRSRLVNRVAVLHDPARFGIEVPTLSAAEREIIEHSLGLGHPSAKGKPYRTHYCATLDDPRLPALAARGLMERGQTTNNGTMVYYFVTEAGALAVGHRLPE